MLTTEEIQKLLEKVNFKWLSNEISIDTDIGKSRSLMDVSTYTITISVLLEVLAECKQIKKDIQEIKKYMEAKES